LAARAGAARRADREKRRSLMVKWPRWTRAVDPQIWRQLAPFRARALRRFDFALCLFSSFSQALRGAPSARAGRALSFMGWPDRWGAWPCHPPLFAGGEVRRARNNGCWGCLDYPRCLRQFRTVGDLARYSICGCLAARFELGSANLGLREPVLRSRLSLCAGWDWGLVGGGPGR
jgi:hypothetical protein